MSVEAYARVLKLVGTVPLFRRLTEAHFPADFLVDARHNFIVGPKLAHVHLHLRNTEYVGERDLKALAEQIKQLQNTIPALKSVAVNAKTLPVDGILTQAVLSRSDLTSVSISSVPKEDKGRILQLLLDQAHIRHIEITAFTGGDQFFVVNRCTDGTPTASIKMSFGQGETLPADLTRAVSSRVMIERLDVTMPIMPHRLRSNEVSATWRDFLSSIAQDISCTRQVSLVYMSERLPPGGTNPPFFETFGPLLSLSELEELDLYFAALQFVFNDEDVLRMASAWPHLRTFEVQSTKWTSIPTMASLRELARGCPQLERLKMPLDASTNVPNSEQGDDTDHDTSPPHGLRVLAPSFSGMKAENVPGLAQFVKSLFPNVRLENMWTSAEVQLARSIDGQ
jgi:hypothetical protein